MQQTLVGPQRTQRYYASASPYDPSWRWTRTVPRLPPPIINKDFNFQSSTLATALTQGTTSHDPFPGAYPQASSITPVSRLRRSASSISSDGGAVQTRDFARRCSQPGTYPSCCLCRDSRARSRAPKRILPSCRHGHADIWELRARRVYTCADRLVSIPVYAWFYKRLVARRRIAV